MSSPADTVMASINCSFQEDVPIIIVVFAFEINLSTVFYINRMPNKDSKKL
jgi:hypothetical protein